MAIRIRRVYEPYEDSDGRRILIDGLWPRGMKKDDPRAGQWMKELAPSAGLRKHFNHRPELWAEFKTAYHRELDEKPQAIATLRTLAESESLTLVFAAREERFNNAVALLAYLQGTH